MIQFVTFQFKAMAGFNYIMLYHVKYQMFWGQLKKKKSSKDALN